jgi:hypothetical protein
MPRFFQCHAPTVNQSSPLEKVSRQIHVNRSSAFAVVPAPPVLRYEYWYPQSAPDRRQNIKMGTNSDNSIVIRFSCLEE